MRYITRQMIFDDVLDCYQDIAMWCAAWENTSTHDVWQKHCGPYKGGAFPHAMPWEAFAAELQALQAIAATADADCLEQAYGLLGCRLEALPGDEMCCCECEQKDVVGLLEFGEAEERGATCLDSETVPPKRVCVSCLAEASRLIPEAIHVA